MSNPSTPFDTLPFIWGSANAAYQSEGAWNVDGKGLSEWDYFTAQDHMNLNHVDGRVASDFYHHFKEDIDLMAEGGQNSFRFSLSWSRIIPEGRGSVNEKGIEFYNEVINYCLKKGVEPNIVLLQYDMPYQLALEGGWNNAALADAFADYARVCFEHFGDRVRLWSTLDEPQFYAYNATMVGTYPPCRKADVQSYMQWQYNEMLASAKAVKIYHELNQGGLIGVVHNYSLIETAPQTKDNETVFTGADFFNNRMILCPALEGKLPDELDHMLKQLGTYLYRVPNDEEIFAAGKVDYLNLNVYCRKYVTDWQGGPTQASANAKGAGSKVIEGQVVAPLYETCVDPNATYNAWGRELRPRIMYDSLMDLKERYGNPLTITENGHGEYETPNAAGYVEDDGRIEVIGQFLDYLKAAREDGANVHGYYIWCSSDAYSWVNGYDKRYGLIRVDFDDNCKRIPKKSWEWFRSERSLFY